MSQSAHPFATLARANRALTPWGFALYRYTSPAGAYFRIISVERDDARQALAEEWQASHEYFGNVHQFDHLSPEEWKSSIRDFLAFALADGRLR